MKSNQIIKWSCRSLGLSITAMLIAVIGLVHAGPMNVTPAGESAVRAWSVPYNPVSGGMITGLQGFLRTETGVGLLAQVPSLGIIERLNADSEAHRRIIGAMALPAGFENQLQTALQTSDNKALTGALVTILSAYHSQNAEGKIGEVVQSRADEIVALVNQGKMSVAELSAAASELAPFASISDKAQAIGEMASTARATNTMGAAKRIASTLVQGKGSVTSEQTETTDETVSGKGQKTRADDGQVAVAKGLVEELQRADNVSYSEGVVDRLQALAEKTPKEAVQRVIVRGLVADMNRADDVSYSQYVIDALKSISSKTTFDNTQEIAIQGIMDDVFRASDRSYSEEALDAVEHIASQSSSKRVKGVAISLMLQEMRNNNDSDYSELIQEKIDAIAKTGDGLANIPVPQVPDRPSKQSAGQVTAKGLVEKLNHVSDNTWLFVKIGAALAAFLIALKVTPAEFSAQMLSEIGGAFLLNLFFGPLRDRKFDGLIFVTLMAALLAVPFLAPPAMILTALSTIGGAYLLMLFFL